MISIGAGPNFFSMAYSEASTIADACETILFLHGEESSKETWSSSFEFFRRVYRVYAVDLRGHGFSSLGDPLVYSLKRVVEDIHEFVIKNRIANFVLVSHSLGARIAVAYAGLYPIKVKALIIEDMEMIPRTPGKLATEELERIKNFQTTHSSLELAKEALSAAGYPDEKIEQLIRQNRVRTSDGETKTVQIGINPYAAYLAKHEILASEEALKAFKSLRAFPFPVHLFIAEHDSSVSLQGLQEMQRFHPRIIVTHFKGANHSIHETASENFNKSLDTILQNF